MDVYNKELIDEKFKVVNHRVDDLECEVKNMKDLTNAIVAVDKKVDLFAKDTTNKIDNLTSNVTEIKSYVAEKKKKPAEWIEKLVWIVIAGGIGYLLSFIFR